MLLREPGSEQRIRLIKQIVGINGASGNTEMTPEKAEKLLKLNRKNRTLSKTTVERYAKAMREGKWVRSNDSITFDRNGYLSNGQHRLTAVVKSGTKVEMTVTFDVDNHPEMDRGKQRTISDNISLSSKFQGKEIANHKDLHQIATVLVRILKNGKAETYDVELILEKYGDDLVKAKEDGLFKGSDGLSNKAISAAIFVASINKVDIELLKRLRSILNSGISLSVYDSPIIALRDKLNGIKGGGAAVEKERYKRTMYAIDALERKLKRKVNTENDPKYTIIF